MKNSVLVLICLLGFKTTLLSQAGYCVFDSILRRNMDADPQLKFRLDSLEKMIHDRMDHQEEISKRTQIVIPMVIHVVWKNEEDNISDGRILDQIDMLNTVFTNQHPDLNDVPDEFKPAIGNPNLNFCLAAIDPFGNPTSGIVRVETDIDKIGRSDSLFYDEKGGSTAWDTHRYLNIWIVGNFGATGYGSFPEDGLAYRDGVLLWSHVVEVNNPDNNWGNGRVAVHEIGHYLGLHHIWGDDLYAEDSLCLNDDGFSDTPPQWRWSYRCPNDLYPPPYSCGNNNMYVDFMDYSPDQCLSMFTAQQSAYMRNVLMTVRSGLLDQSVACLSEFPLSTDFTFNFFPNPAGTQVKIHLNPSITLHDQIRLYNVSGMEVWSYTGFLYDNLEITLPALPPGIYIARLNEYVQKIILI